MEKENIKARLIAGDIMNSAIMHGTGEAFMVEASYAPHIDALRVNVFRTEGFSAGHSSACYDATVYMDWPNALENVTQLREALRVYGI